MLKTLTMAAMGLLAFALSTGASAQGVGRTFPGVAPSVPSPGGAPSAPAVAPGPAAPIAPGPAAPVAPGPVAPGAAAPDQKNAGRPRIVKVPGLPTVVIPRGPAGRNSYSDRVARCVQYGTAAGVPAGEMGRFTSHCAR